MSGCEDGSHLRLGQVHLVVCFKYMFCNSRGSDISFLKGPTMFLQAQVQ